MLTEAQRTYQFIGAERGAAGASSAATGLGDLAMDQGRFDDAVRFFEVGAARDVGEKSPDRAAIKFTSAAFAHLAAGRKSQAIAVLQGQIALASGDPRGAIKVLTEANGILDSRFGQFDLGRAFLAADQLQQAESAFDSAIARRGEALSLMDEGPTYSHVPVAYYYQGKCGKD
jgi:tetratricopeptide (TPR) repeat protein